MVDRYERIKNSLAITIAEQECYESDALQAENFNGWFDKKVRIRITSYRKRLLDSDNPDAKAVIDELVRAGVFTDDSPDYIEAVNHDQIQTQGQEFTVIVVTEI